VVNISNHTNKLLHGVIASLFMWAAADLIRSCMPPAFKKTKATWQFEGIRDRVVVEQCEKLQDPDAF